jgi:hypothetical protein
VQQVASNDWPEHRATTVVAHPRTPPKKFQPFISIAFHMLRFQADFQFISPTDTKIKFLTGFLAVWFFRTHGF